MKKFLTVLPLILFLGCMGNPIGTYERQRTTEIQETKNETQSSDLKAEIIRDYVSVPTVSTNSIVQDKTRLILDVKENSNLESDVASESSDSKVSKISPFVAFAVFCVGVAILFGAYIGVTKFTALGKTFDTVSSRVGQELEDLMTESNDPKEQLRLKKIKDLLKK